MALVGIGARQAVLGVGALLAVDEGTIDEALLASSFIASEC